MAGIDRGHSITLTNPHCDGLLKVESVGIVAVHCNDVGPAHRGSFSFHLPPFDPGQAQPVVDQPGKTGVLAVDDAQEFLMYAWAIFSAGQEDLGRALYRRQRGAEQASGMLLKLSSP